MARKEHHIVPSAAGGWNIKRNDACCVSIHAQTKAEAVIIGRVMSQRSGSALVIHGKEEKAQRPENHGYSPL